MTTKYLISTFAQHILSEYICYLLSLFAQHIFSGYLFDTFDQQSQADQTICSANIFLSAYLLSTEEALRFLEIPQTICSAILS